MILHHLNEDIKEVVLDKLIKKYKTPEYWNNKSKFHTSYYSENTEISDVDEFIVKYYGETVDRVMGDLSLAGRCDYQMSVWVQIYDNETIGHEPHDHFASNEFVSFVHFIDAPEEQNCFYLMKSDGGKIYPTQQRSGDMLFFPSWMQHGVDPVIDEGVTRVVISGNIQINRYYTAPIIYEHTDNDGVVMWKIQDLNVDDLEKIVDAETGPRIDIDSLVQEIESAETLKA
jgi:hypothetical protein